MSGSSPIYQDRTFAQYACFLRITANPCLSSWRAVCNLISAASSEASSGELMDQGECNTSLWKERNRGRQNWQSDRDSRPMFVGGKLGWRTTTGTRVCDELEATGRASPDTGPRLLSCLQTSSDALVRQIGCSMYRRLLAESDSTHPKLHPGDRILGRFAGSVPGSKAAAKDHATGRAPRMSSAC